MKQLIDKNNLISAISHVISGIVVIIGSLLLTLAGQMGQIAVLSSGFLIIFLGVLILFKEEKILKFAMPGIYLILGIIYLIAMILDINKGLIGMGLLAEIFAFVIFIALAVISVLKSFMDLRNFWVKAIEVLLCFLMAATIFFALFSDASFGYKFSKMNETEALQIFYLILVFGGYTILTISNSLYPSED